MPEIELSGHPALIRGGGSFGDSAMINPIITDGQGFTVHRALNLSLKDGFAADLSGTRLEGTLRLSGQGSARLDRITTTPTPEAGGFYQHIAVVRNAIHQAQEASHNLTLTGENGEAGITVEGEAYPPDALRINLSNWTLRPVGPHPPTPNGFRVFDPAPQAARKAHITINGKPRTGAWGE
jgi:hypothetical protein